MLWQNELPTSISTCKQQLFENYEWLSTRRLISKHVFFPASHLISVEVKPKLCAMWVVGVHCVVVGVGWHFWSHKMPFIKPVGEYTCYIACTLIKCYRRACVCVRASVWQIHGDVCRDRVRPTLPFMQNSFHVNVMPKIQIIWNEWQRTFFRRFINNILSNHTCYRWDDLTAQLKYYRLNVRRLCELGFKRVSEVIPILANQKEHQGRTNQGKRTIGYYFSFHPRGGEEETNALNFNSFFSSFDGTCVCVCGACLWGIAKECLVQQTHGVKRFFKTIFLEREQKKKETHETDLRRIDPIEFVSKSIDLTRISLLTNTEWAHWKLMEAVGNPTQWLLCMSFSSTGDFVFSEDFVIFRKMLLFFGRFGFFSERFSTATQRSGNKISAWEGETK